MVKINKSYRITDEDILNITHHDGLTVAKHRRKCRYRNLHYDATTEPKNIKFVKWTGKTAYLAVTSTNEEKFCVNLAFDICRGLQLRSVTRKS